MKVLTAAIVVFSPLVLFAIESIQENSDGLSNNALIVQNGIFRRNWPFQQSVSMNFYNKAKNFILENIFNFRYWNSDLGNENSILIEFGNEKKMIHNWLKGKPLKVITHGWLGSDMVDIGVFSIKTAYVTVGGFNVITVDWSLLSRNLMYTMPAYLTTHVGSQIAKLLENLVKLAVIDPSDIHVIGHSLGAHISGACGAAFGLGKIGRITGLDPAGPGFDDSGVMNLMKVRSDHLDSTDALFVDVIHTASGSLGYSKSIGSIDFYPNGGKPSQPGCTIENIPGVLPKIGVCSHARSFNLYADSVYHRNSLIAVQCQSWEAFVRGDCKNNVRSPMGHDANPEMRGDFYLNTTSESPFGISDAES